MDENEIREALKKKFDDEYTIKMFTNFVMEFQECFGDIMPAEQVIERINKNIFGNIKIVKKLHNESLDGRYGDDGVVYLREDVAQNERYAKYLFFHEMLHALTSVRDENGIEQMMGFSYLKQGYGMGLNEAITEYLTQIRNERFETDRDDLISGYRTIVEQMRRMINIFGKEEIFHYYFYEPQKFKEFINSKGMNYDEIEKAFRELIAKDLEVYSIGHGKKLNNNDNYTIPRNSKIIFDNYSKAIGDVNSLEEFEKKYRILQAYDKNYDSVITMSIPFYNSMGRDIDNLLKKGIKIDRIRAVLGKLHIRFDECKTMYSISKSFGNDKNQTAIALYNLYMKNPNLYFHMFANNYAYIYDYFREDDTRPGDELYDAFSYPALGSVLRDNPQIEFSDISYYRIEESKSKMHCYLFYTSDSEAYMRMADGKIIPAIKGEDGSYIFKIKINKSLICKLKYTKAGDVDVEFEATKDFDIESYMKEVNFNSSQVYSEKSDLEYWIQECGGTDPSFSESLQRINERIKNRKARNKQGER